MSIDTYLSQKTYIYWCSFTQQLNHEIFLAFSFSILWNLSYQSSAPCYLIKLILYLHNPCSNQHALAQFSTLLLNSARYCSIQHAHAQFSTLLSQISTLFLKSARSILKSRFFLYQHAECYHGYQYHTSFSELLLMCHHFQREFTISLTLHRIRHLFLF